MAARACGGVRVQLFPKRPAKTPPNHQSELTVKPPTSLIPAAITAPHLRILNRSSTIANMSDQQQQQVSPAALRKQQELQNVYSNYKQTLQTLAQKIGEVEAESDEHRLVLDTLTPLPKERKCFRLVNGVLLEKTVGEVVPDLTTQKEGLAKVLETLVKDYKKKESELEQWKKTNNIQVVQS
ncbi:hypothetical protein BJ508DRAFT_374112 [Ascobolus immersus RN42]|uniref:Prefoldin beta-like protein n=1 Tax=Ascobolus immersus RN42 TaxID=1160509 RepID=A0A3N4IT50_ASCIM|nr:hypothetical protein BJ508DRAFT_374112 [Ascobolus immersus RN42]